MSCFAGEWARQILPQASKNPRLSKIAHAFEDFEREVVVVGSEDIVLGGFAKLHKIIKIFAL
jgi:hypothetical protein